MDGFSWNHWKLYLWSMIEESIGGVNWEKNNKKNVRNYIFEYMVILGLNSINQTQLWLIYAILNTLRPLQDDNYFADDIFKCIFSNENVWISLKISVKFVPKVIINNIPRSVQIMAWRDQGTSHHLNQWSLIYWRIHASLGLNEIRFNNCHSVIWDTRNTCILQIFTALTITSKCTLSVLLQFFQCLVSFDLLTQWIFYLQLSHAKWITALG